MIYRNGKLITEVHQNIKEFIDQIQQLVQKDIGAIYKGSQLVWVTVYNAIKSNIKNHANYYKFTDGVKYNLGLLQSAASESAFEASEVYHTTKDNLINKYYESDEDQEIIDEFESKFGKYRTGGDVNNIILYSKFEKRKI